MDTATHSPGDILRNRYRIESIIGRGAYGVVYHAGDLTIAGSTWAIKEIWELSLNDDERQEAMELFRKEVSILGELNHTGIPKILEFFSENHHHYIVMEFIEGRTMEDIVAEEKPDPATAVSWAIKICDILDYLHSLKPAPVIFRDLKPSNVMITQRGRLLLIDFGIARFFNPLKGKDTSILGTPGYAPPEQYGKGQSDARSDIYSLGATLFNVLTGHDLASFGFSVPPLSRYNSRVTTELERIVEKCLNRDPSRRYVNAAELKRELVTSLDASTSRAPSAASLAPQLQAKAASQPQPLFAGAAPMGLVLMLQAFCAYLFISDQCDRLVFSMILCLTIVGTLVSMLWYLFKSRMDYAILTVFCTVILYMLTPNFIRSRSSPFTACKSNLKNIGTAMEMYSSDNMGRYPISLIDITPNYLKTLPTCPEARKMTYSYAVTVRPDCYTVWCKGRNHKIIAEPDYPKYDAMQGLYDVPYR